MGKAEFYELVKRLRVIASDPINQECSCPKINCEWHGDCVKCVTIHRYFKDHVPNCMQQFINDKLKTIATIGEMDTIEKEKTPAEYWEYVREQDKINKEKKLL